jgi:hypothetical protein
MAACAECSSPLERSYAELRIPNGGVADGAIRVCLGCWPRLRTPLLDGLRSDVYSVVLRGDWFALGERA